MNFGYLYIFGTVFFTVYGQLVLKWQVNQAGSFPSAVEDKIWFIARLLLNPWVLSGLTGAFLAFLCWMIAMTKFDLSRAYPFTSLGFALVLILSAIFFNEPITRFKILGVLFIMIGIFIGSRG